MMNAVLAGMIGMPQVWIILVVVFGGRKIPELMKGLGKGVKEFKNATNTEDENSKGEVEEPKK